MDQMPCKRCSHDVDDHLLTGSQESPIGAYECSVCGCILMGYEVQAWS